MWLLSFSDRLTSELEYNTDHLRGAESKDVKDIDLLLKCMETEFPPIIEDMQKSFRELFDVKKEMFRENTIRYPDWALLSVLLGNVSLLLCYLQQYNRGPC